ncbi:MAG TPA: class I SAM-dependent methyltransferase [Polyangiaceae bacterium]|jgi:SAM-dependent methyltransferase|nr:class I SAM-dependent methyltransferase [Polyangiaceae bacterium]
MNAPPSRASSDGWDRHWSAHAASNALNPAQAYRRRLIFGALDLSRARDTARVLEIGSGQGELSSEIKQRYPEADLVGVDLSDTGVALAQTKVPSGVFFQQDLRQPMAIPERYRAWATHAVCSEVLEHLDDPVLALRHARACLAPGATLVLTVPAGPMSAFDRHIGHRAHFTRARLRQVLVDAGLNVEAIYGAGFPFFNLYRLTVIARGRRLINDADGALPGPARAMIWLFSRLFSLNSRAGRLGWQLLAVAREPEQPRR